jgi:hypothetical protein
MCGIAGGFQVLAAELPVENTIVARPMNFSVTAAQTGGVWDQRETGRLGNPRQI